MAAPLPPTNNNTPHFHSTPSFPAEIARNYSNSQSDAKLHADSHTPPGSCFFCFRGILILLLFSFLLALFGFLLGCGCFIWYSVSLSLSSVFFVLELSWPDQTRSIQIINREKPTNKQTHKTWINYFPTQFRDQPKQNHQRIFPLSIGTENRICWKMLWRIISSISRRRRRGRRRRKTVERKKRKKEGGNQ